MFAIMYTDWSKIILQGTCAHDSTGRKTERQTEKKVRGQHSGVDRDILRQITEGSARSGQIAGGCQEVISRA